MAEVGPLCQSKGATFHCMCLQVCDVIWVCDKGQVTPWEGDIFSYKEHLKKQIDRVRGRKEGGGK